MASLVIEHLVMRREEGLHLAADADVAHAEPQARLAALVVVVARAVEPRHIFSAVQIAFAAECYTGRTEARLSYRFHG